MLPYVQPEGVYAKTTYRHNPEFERIKIQCNTNRLFKRRKLCKKVQRTHEHAKETTGSVSLAFDDAAVSRPMLGLSLSSMMPWLAAVACGRVPRSCGRTSSVLGDASAVTE